jgi:tetratricopeptide (TPR) repeat protein
MPKPCLLILDNANESKYILDFKDTFQHIGWNVLITSRCQKVLAKEQEIAINHLPPAQAKALFLQHYSENTPNFDSLLDKLLQAVGYNTLCVEIFAKTLAEIAPLGENITSLLEDIKANGMYLGEKSFEIHTNYIDNTHIKAANSDEILEKLYDLAHLKEAEKTLLLRFALLPTENYEPIFLASLFTPENMFTFGQELISLAKKGWLTTNTKTYRLSPVIQSLLLTKEKENVWEAARLIVDKVNEKLKNKDLFLLLPLHEAQPYSLVAESLIENVKEDNEYMAYLISVLSDYYINIGNFNRAILLLEKSAAIYQAIREEYNYGICLSRLGNIYVAQGKLSIAKEYRKKEVALYKKRYEANPMEEGRKRSLAIAYEKLGDIYEIEKEYGKARDFYQKIIDLLKPLYRANIISIDSKNELAIAYSKIGVIYEQTKDLDNALQFYQKDLKLIEEIYQISPTEYIKNGLAISYFNIGRIFYLKKEYVEALSFYQKDYQLTQELVTANPTAIELLNGLAGSYHHLGEVYQAIKKISVAKEHFIAAEKILRELVEKVPDYVELRENWEEVKRDLEGLG